MSEISTDSQAAKDQSDLINDLEALLAMCRMVRRTEGDITFERWMIVALILGFLGVVGLILMQPYALLPICLALISAAFGMCNYPVNPTMTKEQCAQVFSRFNHLPDRETLLERYARNGTLSYQEVSIPLSKALYDLRLEARKTEIFELAKGVKGIPSTAV